MPNGPLTEHLQKIQPGDTILMRKKPVGTLVNDALIGGERLWLFSTGTGIAPFASVIRDPETYEKFAQVILCHTCREVAELEYGNETVAATRADPLVGEEATAQLVHYATTTREESPRMGRITDLVTSGKVFADLGVPPLDPAVDRGMICGSMAFLKDTKALLEQAGLTEGANSQARRIRRRARLRGLSAGRTAAPSLRSRIALIFPPGAPDLPGLIREMHVSTWRARLAPRQKMHGKAILR